MARIWPLIGLILAATGCRDEPADLLARLGSTDPAVRGAAAAGLCSGRAAAGPLQAALKRGLSPGALEALASEPACATTLPASAWAGVLAVAGRIGLDARARARVLIGQPVWVELGPRQAAAPGAPADWWIRVEAVRAKVDGRPQPERAFRLLTRLGSGGQRTVELATLVGPAAQALGRHEIELAFSASILARPDKAALWTGWIPGGRLAFELVAQKPADLLPAVAAPAVDPASVLELMLQVGGKRVAVFPDPGAAPVVQLVKVPSRIGLVAAARRPMTVGLAYEIQARAGPGEWRPVGQASVSAAALGAEPRTIGWIETDGLVEPAGGLVRLRLVPSSQVGLRSVDLRSYWDRSLELEPVRVEVPAQGRVDGP